MKKLIVVIFLFLMLVNIKSEMTNFTLLDYFSGEYEFYTNEQIENGIDLGFCVVANNSIHNCSKIGEKIILTNYEVGKIIVDLKAEIVKTEILLEGFTVIYAYSNLIKKWVEVDFKKVNIQIAVKEENVIVGWPLILGSF